jgi:hypothetical protein
MMRTVFLALYRSVTKMSAGGQRGRFLGTETCFLGSI